MDTKFRTKSPKKENLRKRKDDCYLKINIRIPNLNRKPILRLLREKKLQMVIKKHKRKNRKEKKNK
jgi:hypothetical protein